MIKLAVADDHSLFRKSLRMMLESFDDIAVIGEAANGTELPALFSQQVPDIILLDVHMPAMDGPASARWIKEHYPSVKIIAVSMNDEDTMILKMVHAGCCAYLLKDTGPDVLETAIREVFEKGSFNGDAANINFRRLLQLQIEQQNFQLSEKEKLFLQLACSDLTYKQIAAQMELAERTVDGYREALFVKLNVQSAVGMVMEAIRRKLVEL